MCAANTRSYSERCECAQSLSKLIAALSNNSIWLLPHDASTLCLFSQCTCFEDLSDTPDKTLVRGFNNLSSPQSTCCADLPDIYSWVTHGKGLLGSQGDYNRRHRKLCGCAVRAVQAAAWCRPLLHRLASFLAVYLAVLIVRGLYTCPHAAALTGCCCGLSNQCPQAALPLGRPAAQLWGGGGGAVRLPILSLKENMLVRAGCLESSVA